MLLSQGNAVAYRIATAFGISPRLRLDLLVNEFVHRALHERKLEVYQGDASRSFIHVCDIARAFCLAVENPNPMLGQVFNLGSESLNFTKMEICQMIQRRLPLVQIVASETGFDPDQRNYAVSYAKLRGLGYQTTISLDEGINELAAALQHIADRASYSNARAV
jgi:nucleoside-diphosphate-sugar epimerase